jgi:hypothetical protein
MTAEKGEAIKEKGLQEFQFELTYFS